MRPPEEGRGPRLRMGWPKPAKPRIAGFGSNTVTVGSEPMYVTAAARKCSIACSQEVADMYPAFRSASFAVALLGVRTRRCLITAEID